ncbi:hypothetical protein CryarDRAFT_3561 [Cryptosporangium arvum DSM 44712]|uniref:Uncharacterized protein n=1 Tax=Cryptosporangium arvum DSM 44712 TaxID=927661 RepID=A0A010Z4V9_9ACTN|nr:hypothetical protein CryarDRAFT_3561 [Cryptosporangium arvum DSM 44712]
MDLVHAEGHDDRVIGHRAAVGLDRLTAWVTAAPPTTTRGTDAVSAVTSPGRRPAELRIVSGPHVG